MKGTLIFSVLASAAIGGAVVYFYMDREPETMKPAVDVTKIGTHALMPEHEGAVEDAWMDPEHRDDHSRVEQSMFFTESGLYTKADIEKNGKLTPAEKFKGIASKHDFRPKAGDTICPITQTRANPKFTWWIGGKEYKFCCPPCIEEFVRMARDEPEKIKDPEDYLKK